MAQMLLQRVDVLTYLRFPAEKQVRNFFFFFPTIASRSSIHMGACVKNPTLKQIEPTFPPDA